MTHNTNAIANPREIIVEDNYGETNLTANHNEQFDCACKVIECYGVFAVNNSEVDQPCYAEDIHRVIACDECEARVIKHWEDYNEDFMNGGDEIQQPSVGWDYVGLDDIKYVYINPSIMKYKIYINCWVCGSDNQSHGSDASCPPRDSWEDIEQNWIVAKTTKAESDSIMLELEYQQEMQDEWNAEML
tara:strand:+ start:749 stop:1312 length:564 start_codon:yes stop_codon:yes gene_type:complete